MWTCHPVSLETSCDNKTLRSLYTTYQTICAVDSYCHSCTGLGSDVHFSNSLHSGTSDCVISESDDPDSLWKRSSWVGEMSGWLQDMAVAAARRWQDAMLLSSDNAAEAAKVSLDVDHFDK